MLKRLEDGASNRGRAAREVVRAGATALAAAIDLGDLADTEAVVEVHLAGDGSWRGKVG